MIRPGQAAPMPRAVLPVLGAVALWALALVTACQEEDSAPVDFGITLAFGGDNTRALACGPCEEYSFKCGGHLTIRFADPEDHAETRELLLSKELAPASNVCEGLEQSDIRFGRLHAGMTYVEVTLWASAKDHARAPVGDLYDLQGQPRTDAVPAPIMGGAVYFDIGTSSELIVPISCVAPDKLARCLGSSR